MLMICRNCGTRFAVGAHRCPQCTAEDAVFEGEEGEDFVPKISVVGGPSNAGVDESTEAEEPAVESTEVERPAGNASRDEWLQWAIDSGYDPDELEDYSRDDLRELD